MKQRTDYVTNSSSSSFIFDKTYTLDEIKRKSIEFFSYILDVYNNIEKEVKTKDEKIYKGLIKARGCINFFDDADKVEEQFKLRSKIMHVDFVKELFINWGDKIKEKYNLESIGTLDLEDYFIETYMKQIKEYSENGIDLWDLVNDKNRKDMFISLVEVADWYNLNRYLYKDLPVQWLIDIGLKEQILDEYFNLDGTEVILSDCFSKYISKYKDENENTEEKLSEELLNRLSNCLYCNEYITDSMKEFIINSFVDNVGQFIITGWCGDDAELVVLWLEKNCKYACNHMG